MTGKQYGYVIQALAESARRYQTTGNRFAEQKIRITLQGTLKVKHLSDFFQSFDDEQLLLIVQALEETAELRQIFGTTFDAEMMRETARVVRSVQEGMTFEAAI